MDKPGDQPLQLRTSGSPTGCANVEGLARQFFGKIKDFALAQSLPIHTGYRDLPGGGQIFAQYGPAGRQTLEITVPDVGGELTEVTDMVGPGDLPDETINLPCDCKNVIIYCGEVDWGDIQEVKGRSGKDYYAKRGNYPYDYSLYIPATPVKHVQSYAAVPKIKDKPGTQCSIYQNPGPEEKGAGGALFFSVAENKFNDEEGRHLPVMTPRKCAGCYYWKLEPALGTCDGQIYEGMDLPCGLDASKVGKDEYEYRKNHEQKNDTQVRDDDDSDRGNGEYESDSDISGKLHDLGSEITTVSTTVPGVELPTDATVRNIAVDPTSYQPSALRTSRGTAVKIADHIFFQAGYRPYFDTDCLEPDGTFVWYIPPRNEPRSRCETKQTLSLYCSKDDKKIASVPITVVYNREAWTFHLRTCTDNWDNSYACSKDETETISPCVTTSRWYAAITATQKIKDVNGYIYAVDSDGTIHHIGMWYCECSGDPFGKAFPSTGRYANGRAFGWSESELFNDMYPLLPDTDHPESWNNVSRLPIDWELGRKQEIKEHFTVSSCGYEGYVDYEWDAVLRTERVPPVWGPLPGFMPFYNARFEENSWYSDCGWDVTAVCPGLPTSFSRRHVITTTTTDFETGIFTSIKTGEWSTNSDSGSVNESYTINANKGTAYILVNDELNHEATCANDSDYQVYDHTIWDGNLLSLTMGKFMVNQMWRAHGTESDVPCE